MISHSIFVGLPTYGGHESMGLPGFESPSARHRTVSLPRRDSQVAKNFNELLAQCHNWNIDHAEGKGGPGPFTCFAMLHSDIEAPAGWLDTLADEMERLQADVVSNVVLMKDERRLTSTAARCGYGISNLSEAEVQQLPESFMAEDLRSLLRLKWEKDLGLLINTGCMLLRLGAWVHKFPGFQYVDRILHQEDGRMSVRSIAEDWGFSVWAAEQGLKIAATRKVALGHWGIKRYALADKYALGQK